MLTNMLPRLRPLWTALFGLRLLLPCWSARAACVAPGFNPGGSFCNGCTYEGTMTLKRDEACERNYFLKSNSEKMMVYVGNQVIKRAQHGIAGANGRSFAYKPNKGYVGPDDFIVQVTYLQGDKAGKFNVHWTVTVQ